MAHKKLAKFLLDATQDPVLYQRCHDDLDGAMNDAGLNPHEQDLVRNKDESGIKKHLDADASLYTYSSNNIVKMYTK